MDVSPTAPLQPFRQSVSSPPCTRPRSLPPSFSLSLFPPPFSGGHRASHSPSHPFPLSLAASPSFTLSQQKQQQQQHQKGSKKGLSTPPVSRSLPLSPTLSYTLPHSPAVPTSPHFSYWGGDWRDDGSIPVVGGTFIAPLPSVEVCDSCDLGKAETL